MSDKPSSDPAPEMTPIVMRGRQTVVVAAVKNPTNLFAGIPPHVIMRPHVLLRLDEDTNSQSIQLTAKEARTLAISLLQAADAIDWTPGLPISRIAGKPS